MHLETFSFSNGQPDQNFSKYQLLSVYSLVFSLKLGRPFGAPTFRVFEAILRLLSPLALLREFD